MDLKINKLLFQSLLTLLKAKEKRILMLLKLPNLISNLLMTPQQLDWITDCSESQI